MKACTISLLVLSASVVAFPVHQPRDVSSTPVAIDNATTVPVPDPSPPADPAASSLIDPDGFGKGGKGGKGGGSGNTPLNALLSAVAKFPVVGAALDTIGGLLTELETKLAVALNVQTTQQEAGCTAMTVIFARGTTEPGNVGLVTGPPFFDALNSMLGAAAVTIQGVNYGATIEGFLEGGDPQGAQMMAQMVQSTLATCPTTKIVMSGYSQGGQIVHNAAKLLPAATMAKVSSVLIFGDPDFGQAVAGASAAKTKVICHKGDNICEHGDLILIPHLTYGENAQEAATFVSAQAGLAMGNL